MQNAYSEGRCQCGVCVMRGCWCRCQCGVCVIRGCWCRCQCGVCVMRGCWCRCQCGVCDERCVGVGVNVVCDERVLV